MLQLRQEEMQTVSDEDAFTAAPGILPDADSALDRALDALLKLQRDDGHWVFELEADATIPAEYVLMVHYLGETPDTVLEARIGRYLRRLQNADGSWPLFSQGAADISVSVKAYFALKMIGDDIESEHMRRARASIHAQGGIEESNVFTRTLLALFGIFPWQAVPMMPVELLLLPSWFPFHQSKISYWARTVMVPLLVLNSLQPLARNPRGVKLDELFFAPHKPVRLPRRAAHQGPMLFGLFRGFDTALRVVERWFPDSVRRRAIARAEQFVRERLNGDHGLGAIFPAMVNAVMMFDALGTPSTDADMKQARASIDRLLVLRENEAYCQPCLSPVWDTSLACHALLEVGGARATAAAERGLAWLRPLQVRELYGDWSFRRPGLRPGGWAFQYENAYYPDVDDTAVVVMALHRADPVLDSASPKADYIARGAEWVSGMQSANGGWGAFEPENTHFHLNHIPFADHGALLDPPTVDVSARCLSMLAQLEGNADSKEARSALRYILDEQEANGSWFGRWGTNYIYGTWSALCGLNAAGLPPTAPAMRRAAEWLIGIQNDDGGWGEDGDSYRLDYQDHVEAPSTASQTAWALLGLMSAGAFEHPAVARGIAYLVRAQDPDGTWQEGHFTAVGFPRVFYLRYHGYARYFPLWALARYNSLRRAGGGVTKWGM